MLIINPIYDVAFKYLMEDTELASQILSAIIGEEIISLELQPQEHTIRSKDISLTVVRLDFKAVIRTENGTKKVLIELQKGKQRIDTQRFRRYLGQNYIKPDIEVDEQGKSQKINLPIITIYFIGFKLSVEKPVIKVSRNYTDVLSGEILEGVKDEFIETLTHDCYVIQIPFLQPSIQTSLERILLVFNQRFIKNDEKVLDIPSDVKDEVLQKIIRRLSMALTDPDIQEQMESEEIFEEELFEYIRRKEVLVEQKDKEIEARNREIEARNREIEARNRELDTRNKEIEVSKKEIEVSKKEIEVSKKEIESKDKLIEELQKLLAKTSNQKE